MRFLFKKTIINRLNVLQLMEFLEIDGGFGEGGGQIIRTAITLSCADTR